MTISSLVRKADMDEESSDLGSARSVFIKSFGCQMNVYDADRMMDLFSSRGYSASQDEAAADVVVLNTCHIREKAAEKVFSELGRLRELKDEKRSLGKNLKIVVAGCVAQAEGKEILRRQPAVDVVVGPQNYHRLLPLLDASGKRTETEFPLESKFDHLPLPKPDSRNRTVSAFVTIQEGCDKFCTFCVVPYTRGAEVSRPVESIMDEVRALSATGVREITLIGQNVNAYSGPDRSGTNRSLARLIELISEIEEIDRIRYTTSHPRDMREDLLEAHRDVPKLMPYIHLPVQSGSDRVLHEMNRGHSRRDYMDLVDRIRSYRADIAFSSDFIVGFPGETDADFEDTLALVRTVNFASAFSFMYSPRLGTPAAGAADQIDEVEKRQRLSKLQRLLDEQRAAFNLACVDKTMTVLLEKQGRHFGQLVGKTPYLQSVHLLAPTELIGSVVNVKIAALVSNSLSGRMLKELESPV
jgi:tRNA-2-methylthio-N6-dimethylallyladenosine synthase